MRRGLLLALLLSGCGRHAGPTLPPLTVIGPAVQSGAGVLRAADRSFRALYVTAQPRDGIAPQASGLALLDAVAALDEDGNLYVADLLHSERPAAYRQGKLSPQDVLLSSPHGTFYGSTRLFSPVRDPLATIDSGYVVEVRLGQLARQLVFTPLYDAEGYAPFIGQAEAGRPGVPGVLGGTGATGKSGADGSDGSDGFTGAAGRDGEDGDDGEAGGSGTGGRPGLPGAPGDPGPDLEVSVRPIYSKFYPDEALVFVQVQAYFRHVGDGNVYASDTQRYIFHPGQAFVISSLGGAGGDGGDGGRGGSGGPGGKGGDGGDGGDGGNGVDNTGGKGGTGADGGKGGKGGDGGTGGRGALGGLGGLGAPGGDGGAIVVQVFGPPPFQRAVRGSLRMASVAAAGGASGAGGRGGFGGSGGKAGSGGKGGKAGRGGQGRPYGNAGVDGKDGKDGSSGSKGRSGPAGKPGRPGPDGRVKAVTWR